MMRKYLFYQVLGIRRYYKIIVIDYFGWGYGNGLKNLELGREFIDKAVMRF